MTPTPDKFETFFLALEHLKLTGVIKSGKDFILKPEANGKVLYLHLESVYPLYNSLISNDVLSLSSLKSYLECSKSFVKYMPIVFKWEEPMGGIALRKHSIEACAVMLCYDILKSKYNIDFEKHTLSQFEKALLDRNVTIDEVKFKGKYVTSAIGYILGQKHTWKADGSCYTKNGTPNPKYNLIFD